MLRAHLLLGPVLLATSAFAGDSFILASAAPDHSPSNGQCYDPHLSADGNVVVFQSGATNLSALTTTGGWHVYATDLNSGAVELIDVTPAGGVSLAPSTFYFRQGLGVSRDGRYVVFASGWTDLVAGDTNQVQDIFVRDRQHQVTERVSVSTSGQQADQPCEVPQISDDGRFVFFRSQSTTLAPLQGHLTPQYFVHDRRTGETELATVCPPDIGDAGATDARVSGDGRWIAFTAYAYAPYRTGAFLRDLRERVTIPLLPGFGMTASEGSRASLDNLLALSRDARWAVVETFYDLDPTDPFDSLGVENLWRLDLTHGTAKLLTVAPDLSSNWFIDTYPQTAHVSDDGGLVLLPFQSNYVSWPEYGPSPLFECDVRKSVDIPVNLGPDMSMYPLGDRIAGRATASGDHHVIAFVGVQNPASPWDGGADQIYVRTRDMIYAGRAVCAGDGTATTCPCTSLGATDHGCANHSSPNGGLLTAQGTPSISADSLEFQLSDAPATNCWLLQGNSLLNGGQGVPFQAGIACLSGTTLRLAHTTAPWASYATFGRSEGLDRGISVLGHLTSPGTRYYQVWYRQEAATCNGEIGNFSNALRIDWRP